MDKFKVEHDKPEREKTRKTMQYEEDGKREETSQKKRERELLVTGFPFNTPQRKIEEKLEAIQKDLGLCCEDQFALGLLASA
eukprot:6568886-Karenia_brevis.AAC.1